MLNASSNAITSSTVSRESAPRSSTNEASGVTSLASTPSCSTMMLLTFSSTLIGYPFLLAQKAAVFLPRSLAGASRSHVEAPADVQDRARDVGGFVGGQVGHRRGDVVRRAEPAEGNLAGQRFPRGGGRLLRHRGGDETGGDGVAGDVA